MRLALALVLLLAASAAASAQSLGSEPVIFTSGDWTVRRGKHAMTDKVTCTGLYLSRFDVQLNRDALYISLRGRGGVKGYRVRLDEQPSSGMLLPSETEKKISAIAIRGTTFADLVKAQRLRVQVLTVLDGLVTEDLALAGIAEAHAVILGPECQ